MKLRAIDCRLRFYSALFLALPHFFAGVALDIMPAPDAPARAYFTMYDFEAPPLDWTIEGAKSVAISDECPRAGEANLVIEYDGKSPVTLARKFPLDPSFLTIEVYVFVETGRSNPAIKARLSNGRLLDMTMEQSRHDAEAAVAWGGEWMPFALDCVEVFRQLNPGDKILLDAIVIFRAGEEQTTRVDDIVAVLRSDAPKRDSAYYLVGRAAPEYNAAQGGNPVFDVSVHELAGSRGWEKAEVSGRIIDANSHLWRVVLDKTLAPAGPEKAGGFSASTRIAFDKPLPDGLYVAEILFTPPAGADGVLTRLKDAFVFAVGSGASLFSRAEVWNIYRGLEPDMEINLARLNRKTPGAVELLAWTRDGAERAAPGLGDGDCATPAGLAADAAAFGARWPRRHAIDNCALRFSGAAGSPADFGLQVFDCGQWREIASSAGFSVSSDDGSFQADFEPVAASALRVACKNDAAARVSEIDIRRYMPPGPPGNPGFPKRLVEDNIMEKEILSEENDPSFDRLARHGLSMPAWAVMGLKDMPQEPGVGWSGEIWAGPRWGEHVRARATFGDPPFSLALFRDTIRRTLLKGWMPGVVVEGRMGAIRLEQTSFTAPVGGNPEKAGVFIRLELSNASPERVEAPMRIAVQTEKEGEQLSFKDGALLSGDRVCLAGGGEWTAQGNVLAYDLALAPGGVKSFDLIIPLGEWRSAAFLAEHGQCRFEDAFKDFDEYWDKQLAGAMGLDLPETRLNNLYKSVLAQLLLAADKDTMPYGCGPGKYEGTFFGIEEGYAILALGMSGFYADAQRYLEGTYLQKEFMKKEKDFAGGAARHQQYRNGLTPIYAIQLYRMGRDKDWIWKHFPMLAECAGWTVEQRRKTMVLENNEKPLHWGLLPKWSYGGDLGGILCYSFYANLACWKALKETAWLAAELGERELAGEFAGDAREYRAAIENAIDKSYLADRDPPFLPPFLYADESLLDVASHAKAGAVGDYYQLFAGCILDLLPFDYAGKRADYIIGYMEARNLMFCGLPRFREWGGGAGGIDGIYGLGYILTKLHQDKVREFLLGFYAFQVFNMEHDCFTSRETSVIYASDVHLRTAYGAHDVSDPLHCSSAVALLFLRHMLMAEELEGAGGYSNNLLLLPGAPREWFSPGKTISVKDAPTHFGPVSFDVRTDADSGAVQAEIKAPRRNPAGKIKLRLRLPPGREIGEVTVNGGAWADVDRKSGYVILPGDKEDLRVSVSIDNAARP